MDESIPAQEKELSRSLKMYSERMINNYQTIKNNSKRLI